MKPFLFCSLLFVCFLSALSASALETTRVVVAIKGKVFQRDMTHHEKAAIEYGAWKPVRVGDRVFCAEIRTEAGATVTLRPLDPYAPGAPPSPVRETLTPNTTVRLNDEYWVRVHGAAILQTLRGKVTVSPKK